MGKPVASLSAEETLLILCVHGAKHGWNRLMWVCDIAEFLRVNADIDWPWLLQYAKKLGGGRMLLFGLHLANTLLDAELPAEIVRQIQAEPIINSLARQVREELLRGMYDPSGLFEERPFFYMKLRERWQDRTWLFLRYSPEYFHRMITPNEQDHAFLPLPNSLSFLYYLLRPLRLVGTYARQTLQSLQQR
jgi:hypothetical protein